MVVTDPIADMLTRIRNAVLARHDFVLVPFSKIKLSVAGIMKEEGFIRDYEILKGKPQRMLKIYLRYGPKKEPMLVGLKRVSKPGLRVYVQNTEIPRLYGGLGVAVLSTSQGVMTGQRARREQIGGELLCYIW
jgi:small subunit ribosomal protein S8